MCLCATVLILTHPVNFPVGGNRSARRKSTTFGRVLTDSLHMSRALGSSNIEKVLAENRTRNLRGERRAPSTYVVILKQLAISQTSRGLGLVDVWRDIWRDNKL